MFSDAYLKRFLVPALGLVLVYGLALGAIVQYSFLTYMPGSLDVGTPTVENLARLLDPIYAKVFGDSLLIAFFTAAGTLAVGYPLSYAMVRARKPWLRSLLFVVAIMPLFTGEIVRTYAWINILGQNGFINSLLLGLGVIDTPIQMMFTMFGVVLALVHFSLPVMVMILAAGISHIDPAYEKAAATLGAGKVRRFALVTLPLSMPGILSGVITIFAWTLSAFATPQLIGGGKINMISNMVYQLGFASFNFPFAAALSLAAIVMTMVLLGLMTWAQTRLDAKAMQ